MSTAATTTTNRFISALQQNVYPPLTQPDVARGYVKNYIAEADLTKEDCRHAAAVLAANNTLFELNEVMYSPSTEMTRFRSLLTDALRRSVNTDLIRQHPTYVSFRKKETLRNRFAILDAMLDDLI